MRLATITNWAYVATVGLTLVSGATMLLASRAEDRERAAVEQRMRFDALTSAVEEDAYRLTSQARLYSIDASPAHLIVYEREARDLTSVEARVRHLRDAGAQPAELEALRQGLRWADLLVEEQRAAIEAVQAGNPAVARTIMFGAQYERDLERVRNALERFRFLLDERSEAAVARAAEATRAARLASEIMVAITALLFLCVLYFVIKQRILRPVVRLSDVVTRLASQDYAAELPDYSQVDEIGDMTQAIRIFRENGIERQRLERERDADQLTRDRLARMTHRLQGCNDRDDLGAVVALFAAEIAPGFAGRLHVHDRARNLMVAMSDWRSPAHSPPSFPPEQCWAMRRGQLHRPRGERSDIGCDHIDAAAGDTICIPLSAQGETFGLLYLEPAAGAAGAPSISEAYLELLAENVALALANLHLRDELRQIALVDPLTGLPNRRRLDAVLQAELAQADKTDGPLSCAMIDVDHFKRFNDQFGHDAGDAVLREVGDILGSAVREGGMAFRYGGEEFMLLMPGFDSAAAQARCEALRQRLAALDLTHDGQPLGPVTASFGVATYPEHGPGDALVLAADAALLRAKRQGRDRVVVATRRRAAPAGG